MDLSHMEIQLQQFWRNPLFANNCNETEWTTSVQILTYMPRSRMKMGKHYN